MGSAVSLTMMTDSLHSHNSDPRNRVKGFASRGWEEWTFYVYLLPLRARERSHRVEFGGAARGQITGEKRDCANQK